MPAHRTASTGWRWAWPGIASGEELWCQGFSEPDAGSDLAGLRTTAVRDGDHFVVNGQKVWTSLGIYADWMFALVRTNTESKHRGISYLMIPMSSPGIDVRPIRQLHGEPGFAEVFLSDVEVSVANAVGDVDDGWRVARATLGFERALALGNHVRYSLEAGELVDLATRLHLADDPQVRDRVARVFAQTEVFR
ncbi:MAG: acyl-CoA dehydrogenase, partial [Actinophytocola sp.]|nr:acyl-CoA dehydrogenase [Actinophytocola sp.]